MALPLVPLGIGALALLLLSRGKESGYTLAPADGSSPPKKEPAAPAKSWKEMPPALQEQVAAALGALGVSPATGELGTGAVTVDAIKMATQTAALCESQGFYDVANELRRLAEQAARKVPTPPDAAPIQAAAPPGLTPAQIEAISRTLTMDRDPKVIGELIAMLEKLPPSPERDHFIALAQALMLQLAAAQSTTQTMQQIDQVIKSPGIAEVHAAVQPLPPAVIPVVTPPVVKLSTLPNLVTSPGIANTSPNTPSAPVPSYAVLLPLTGTRILGSGAKGSDVQAWQNILRLDGYGATVAADGVFGPKTVAATKDWQKKRGLSPDGKVGPATRGKVGAVLPGAPASRAPVTPSTPLAPVSTAATTTKVNFTQFADPSPNAPTLYRGMPKTAANVAATKSWQSILKAFGYPMGTGGPNHDGLDGDFGPTTEAQTKAFQQYAVDQHWVPVMLTQSSATVDGKVGPVTRRLVLLRTAIQKGAVIGALRRSLRRSARGRAA